MTRLIRVGDTGPAVADVQRRLRRALPQSAAGDLRDDGDFGPETLGAVRAFQQLRGLAADGIVGPETWRSLVDAGYTLGDRLLWHSRRMMRGDDVRELQHRLNALGFDAGPEDGVFGPLAAAAVEEFQRNAGLDADGTAGPRTIAALRRLARDHASGGIGARARARERLRLLAGKSIVGARVLIDPSHGKDDPGHIGPSGACEAEIAWQIASRLSARLAARGANVVLSRGPNTNPTGSERARLANDQGVDVAISVGVNALDVPAASGASTYYYGSPTFVSEGGYRLAQLAQDAMVAVGWQPDCRVHPVTWSFLRETRMPAIVAEPGFITSPVDEPRLVDPVHQDALAQALVDAVAAFFADPEDVSRPVATAGRLAG